MFIGQLFLNFFAAQKKASPKKEINDNTFKAFILEPILTPSGLIDGGDDTPDLSWLDPDDFDLPDPSDIDDSDLSDPQTFSDPNTLADDPDFEVIPFIDTLPEPQFDTGVFTVGETGAVSIDYLYDGGKYQFELAIFSLEGMDQFEAGSEEFIQEAARRALSDSEYGHIVISDRTEGAKFDGSLGESKDWNSGTYKGVQTVQMRAGDQFGILLIPNGKVQEVFDNPNITGAKAPLFSLGTANPDDALHFGQIADVTGDGSTFVMEDVQFGHAWYDQDYNDLVFQIRGATGDAPLMSDLIDPDLDWRDSDLGQALIDYQDLRK